MSKIEIQLKIKPHRSRKLLNIDGIDYALDKQCERNAKSKNKAEVTIKLVKCDVKDYDKTINELAEKISKKTNVKEIISQALYDIPYGDVLEIKKELGKDKPHIRNNKGCFSMTVGKINIPIRD